MNFLRAIGNRSQIIYSHHFTPTIYHASEVDRKNLGIMQSASGASMSKMTGL